MGSKDVPKEKIAQLIQSDSKNPYIRHLSPSEDAIWTDLMSGCCSVVVLSDETANGQFKSVVGQHAAGDALNLAWDQLLDGVPNEPATTIVMSCEKSDLDDYKAKVNKALDKKGFDKVTRKFYGYPDALVRRDGTIEPFDMSKKSMYIIS